MQARRTFGPSTTDLFGLAVTEAAWKVENYADRDGYAPQFLGERLPLPDPAAGKWTEDVIELVEEARTPGSDPTELKYRNFSVRMSKSRKLPLVSAVNINGSLSNRQVERTDVWRRDPRISKAHQNLREAYGYEYKGFFSRGHMTRREDPNWGTDNTILKQADADTFHVTNAAPQRQGFNAGIWLALEDYVIDNA
ncbi:MAG TPA: DNA/RNA non-specific endonuclease, partial [Kaistia sp.]|nr:DNA/RNA non-specific endonuclease [Kaistia sp.]